jgi:hypothetical protein
MKRKIKIPAASQDDARIQESLDMVSPFIITFTPNHFICPTPIVELEPCGNTLWPSIPAGIRWKFELLGSFLPLLALLQGNIIQL